MPRRILMVAYHYPPVRVSSGIQRTLKFSTYLPDHGWDPLVLTVSPKAYERISDDQLGEIPQHAIVERAFGLDTQRHLAFRGKYFRFMAQPDRWVSWWPMGTVKGLQMIRRFRPDVIMATFPIATAHLIGLTLHRLTGVPFVADFRDAMTEPDYPRDPLTWKVQRRLEQVVVRHCDKAVFTTSGTLDMYAERYPEIPADRWTVIENGFDEENFRDAETGMDTQRLAEEGRMVLVHSGVLYPQERDPRPFFGALRSLKDAGFICAGNLRVTLRATGSDPYYRSLLSEYGIEDLVALEGTIPYREALREMMRADGLLLFQAAICNHQIPAKLYEYARSGRPILGLTDLSGNTAEHLRTLGCGNLCDIADETSIRNALTAFVTQWRTGTLRGVSPDTAGTCSRRARSAELARLLDGMVQ